jgi:P-type E1-E2 ATPase
MREAAAARELSLIPAPDAHEVETHGVEATISGKTVFVGKPKYVAKNSSGVIEPELQPGEAAIQVSVDGIFAGSIILRDEIRAETKLTLERLRDLNISHIMMLTGDIDSVAKHIGQELGVDDIRSECLPKDKVTAVSAATPRPVIMVGDGVNDAPVLAASDVGIAMGAKGSTSAAESADVVILLDDLSRVAKTVQIGRRTVKIAIQSIWLGMVMSIALMGVAAAGFLPAILGAATQEIVDLVAILGALRALRSASDK